MDTWLVRSASPHLARGGDDGAAVGRLVPMHVLTRIYDYMPAVWHPHNALNKGDTEHAELAWPKD